MDDRSLILVAVHVMHWGVVVSLVMSDSDVVGAHWVCSLVMHGLVMDWCLRQSLVVTSVVSSYLMMDRSGMVNRCCMVDSGLMMHWSSMMDSLVMDWSSMVDGLMVNRSSMVDRLSMVHWNSVMSCNFVVCSGLMVYGSCVMDCLVVYWCGMMDRSL